MTTVRTRLDMTSRWARETGTRGAHWWEPSPLAGGLMLRTCPTKLGDDLHVSADRLESDPLLRRCSNCRRILLDR